MDSSGLVQGNLCYSNSSEGLRVSGTFTVSGNTSWRNSLGIRGVVRGDGHEQPLSSATITKASISTAAARTKWSFNRVYGNGRTGIYFESNGRGAAQCGLFQRRPRHPGGRLGGGLSRSGQQPVLPERQRARRIQHHRRRQLLAGQARPDREQHRAMAAAASTSAIPSPSPTVNNIIWATGSNSVALVRYTHMDRYPNGIPGERQQLHLHHGRRHRGPVERQPARAGRLAIRHQAGLPQLRRQPAIRERGGRGRHHRRHQRLGRQLPSRQHGRQFHGRAVHGHGRVPRSRPNATTSPAIDAATPSSALGDEIAPNGSRREPGRVWRNLRRLALARQRPAFPS